MSDKNEVKIICSCGEVMTLNVCEPKADEEYLGYDCSCGASFYGLLKKATREERENKIFRIYYAKDFSESLTGGQKVDVLNLDETHVMVSKWVGKDKDQIFHDFQGEVWSPNGEMRPLILALGLKHTSISVGDIVFQEEGCEYWKVAIEGWEKLA